MLKGEVAPVAELVQARGWGREENLKLTAVSPCVHSITPLPPCILWDPRGCCHIPPVLPPAQHHSCTGISLHQDPRTPHCSTPTQPSLWALAMGQGPKKGELLRLFPSADPGIAHCCRAEHIARRSQKRRQDVYTCTWCQASLNWLLWFNTMTSLPR